MIKPGEEERNPVELLCEEFLEQWRKGEAPTIEEYASANAPLQDEIRDLFPAMLAMEKAKESSTTSGARPLHLKVDRLEQIGDYRVVGEIGRGGMAIVYEAEQQSLKRRVALKVFPDQIFEDSTHLKRFEREAKTVAGLHHHNIVPVFGSGQQNGLHYFVMQLLDGITVDQVTRELQEFAETRTVGFEPLRKIVGRWKSRSVGKTTQDHRSSDDSGYHSETSCISSGSDSVLTDGSRTSKEVQRIQIQRDREYWNRVADIGIQVADALQYAHQKGVLHRDIKPSNLIVDADWRIWVTDFGLALEASYEPISQSGDLVGTLLYMAPERLNGKVDARSDIYSLGLTLYELLTFRAAYLGCSKAEIRRQILKDDPPAPRSVCKDIPPDLETIVLKAMARDPAARYQSAKDLLLDLRNFCDDRPIAARRASPLNRLKRWCRRNPSIACLSSALLMCIAVSMTVVTLNWKRAVDEGARAENNMVLALQGMDRLLGRFEADWMEHPIAPDSDAVGAPTELRFVVSDRSAAILQEALSFYKEFAKQNASNPRLQIDTARAYRRVGGIYERLGQLDEAQRAYEKELDKLLVLSANSMAEDAIVDLADSRNRLAMVLNSLYRHRQAWQILQQASSDLNEHLSDRNPSHQVQYSLARTNSNLGKVLWWMRAFHRSTYKHKEAIGILERLVQEHPKDSGYRLSLARAYRDYRFTSFGHREEEPQELQDKAMDLLEGLVDDFPGVPDYRCELSELLTGSAQFGRGEPAERAQSAERAVGLAKQLAEEYPRIPRYRAALARALWASATQTQDSSLGEAETRHDDSIEIYAALCEQYPDVNDYRMFTAQALVAQADCKRKLGSQDAAKSALEKAISAQRQYLQNRRSSIFGYQWLSSYLRKLAKLEREMGNSEHADELEAEAESVQRATASGPLTTF